MTPDTKKSKVTLRQVAKHAGVSVATASMILSQKEGVSFSEETIARVREAADALGYARAEAQPQGVFRQQIIAIFLPSVTGNYYASMARAAGHAASEQGLDSICFETHNDPACEQRGLSALCASDIAGILFTYVPYHYQRVEAIAQSLPVVVIGDRNDSVHLDMVETDSYHTGTLVARHMLELGHRHLAFVATQPDWFGYSGAQRIAGVTDTLAAAGPEVHLTTRIDEATHAYTVDTKLARREIGRSLAEACLADRRITGFIASSDYLAYGVLDALDARGYRVPEDYSVCGIDDVFSSSLPGVSLTTVNHHVTQKGRRAFDMLHRKISVGKRGEAADAEPVSYLRVEYLSTLIPRRSTAPPRQAP